MTVIAHHAGEELLLGGDRERDGVRRAALVLRARTWPIRAPPGRRGLDGGVAAVDQGRDRGRLPRRRRATPDRPGLRGHKHASPGEEAGANHGLVHYYFSSMENLFVRVLERFTDA